MYFCSPSYVALCHWGYALFPMPYGDVLPRFTHRNIVNNTSSSLRQGWPTHEEILRDVVDRHPLLTGLAGCAVVAGVSVALSRALRP